MVGITVTLRPYKVLRTVGGTRSVTDEVALCVLVKWREAYCNCNLILPFGVASPVLGGAFKMRRLSFELLSFCHRLSRYFENWEL